MHWCFFPVFNVSTWWFVLVLLTVVSYFLTLSILFVAQCVLTDVGSSVVKKVTAIATLGFDDRLTQIANDHPITCRLSFAVSLETELHLHGRAGIWFGHNAFCTTFTTHLVVAQSRACGTLINENGLTGCAVTVYLRYRYSLCIAVY